MMEISSGFKIISERTFCKQKGHLSCTGLFLIRLNTCHRIIYPPMSYQFGLFMVWRFTTRCRKMSRISRFGFGMDFWGGVGGVVKIQLYESWTFLGVLLNYD